MVKKIVKKFLVPDSSKAPGNSQWVVLHADYVELEKEADRLEMELFKLVGSKLMAIGKGLGE